MNTTGTVDLLTATPLDAVAVTAISEQEQSIGYKTGEISTRIGRLDFDLGVPTSQTATKLYDEMDFQRAVQCYLWGIPTVGLEEARQSVQQDTGAKNGDLAAYEGYRSVSMIPTPNVVAAYIIGSIDLAEQGPMVIDYPAGLTAGALVDWWDRPITDVGMPGPDMGQGAKFLFVGPGQEAPAAEGYRVFRSRTSSTMFFYRVLETNPDKAKVLRTAIQIYPYAQRDNPPPSRVLTPKPDGELRPMYQPRSLAYWERLAQAVDHEPTPAVEATKKLAKVYLLAQAKNPPPMKFINVSGKAFNTIHANDFTFFEEINHVVQEEPNDALAPETLGLLASIGIEKGKPFAPDERMKRCCRPMSSSPALAARRKTSSSTPTRR
jgi:hypothetical protein